MNGGHIVCPLWRASQRSIIVLDISYDLKPFFLERLQMLERLSSSLKSNITLAILKLKMSFLETLLEISAQDKVYYPLRKLHKPIIVSPISSYWQHLPLLCGSCGCPITAAFLDCSALQL